MDLFRNHLIIYDDDEWVEVKLIISGIPWQIKERLNHFNMLDELIFFSKIQNDEARCHAHFGVDFSFSV
ncbi:unnamed protein product [Callosobruchus maculatus]|uniref:Uncharacterized protein n=1 Tax=Callosobruchus maculatus TaxID=64391 RepID=A0A653CT22_CALMS|nr:unnamed protein product [Callosobruchus maculatus]